MATSEVDRKVLAWMARTCASSNEILSTNLKIVLGISVRLAEKLPRAWKLRTINMARETRSLNLYHEILYLAKEGLATVECLIMPYCATASNAGEFKVMSDKLRASFHHIFCLYHNTPPVRQLRNRNANEARGLGSRWMATRERHVDFSGSPVPSRSPLRSAGSPVLSVQSFVTNPYAVQAHSPDVQTPPVRPHIPPTTYQPCAIPQYPPRLDYDAVVDYDPPVSAGTYLMPALDYTPETNRLFYCAVKAAEAHLPSAHPLRLSLSLEYAAFAFHCLAKPDASLKVIKRAIIAVKRDSGGITDTGFEDAFMIIADMVDIAKTAEAILGVDQVVEGGAVQPVQPVQPIQPVTSPPLYPPPDRELPTPPRQRRDSARLNEFPSPPKAATGSPPGGVRLSTSERRMQSLDSIANESPHLGTGLDGVASRSTTLIGSPPPATNLNAKMKQRRTEPVTPTRKSKRSMSSSSNSPKSSKSRMEAMGSDKARKRRAIERAEEELIRKKRAGGKAGTAGHDD